MSMLVIGLICVFLLIVFFTDVAYRFITDYKNHDMFKYLDDDTEVDDVYRSEVRREQKIENDITKYAKKQIDENTVGRNQKQVEIKKIEITVKDNNVRWIIYYKFNSK